MKTNHCYVSHLLKIYYKWHKDWGSEPKHRMMEYLFLIILWYSLCSCHFVVTWALTLYMYMYIAYVRKHRFSYLYCVHLFRNCKKENCNNNCSRPYCAISEKRLYLYSLFILFFVLVLFFSHVAKLLHFTVLFCISCKISQKFKTYS